MDWDQAASYLAASYAPHASRPQPYAAAASYTPSRVPAYTPVTTQPQPQTGLSREEFEMWRTDIESLASGGNWASDNNNRVPRAAATGYEDDLLAQQQYYYPFQPQVPLAGSMPVSSRAYSQGGYPSYGGSSSNTASRNPTPRYQSVGGSMFGNNPTSRYQSTGGGNAVGNNPASSYQNAGSSSPNSSRSDFLCPECSRSFHSGRRLAEHRQSHFPVPSDPDSSGRYHCACGAAPTLRRDNHLRHLANCKADRGKFYCPCPGKQSRHITTSKLEHEAHVQGCMKSRGRPAGSANRQHSVDLDR